MVLVVFSLSVCLWSAYISLCLYATLLGRGNKIYEQTTTTPNPFCWWSFVILLKKKIKTFNLYPNQKHFSNAERMWTVVDSQKSQASKGNLRNTNENNSTHTKTNNGTSMKRMVLFVFGW
jgi:hypothetical protein